MPRIRSLSLQELDPELRAMLGADHKSEREMRPTSVRAHHPELAKAYVRFAGAFKQHSALSERLRELLRLRIAFHNQCRSCMAMRYADAVADGLADPLRVRWPGVPPRAADLPESLQTYIDSLR